LVTHVIEYSADFDPALPPTDRLLEEITSIVSHAAAAIVAIDRSAVAQRIKPDLSPVTAADDAAQSVILKELSRILPGVPIVSEEMGRAQPIIIKPRSTFLLVDPLDGTREFLAGRDEFTVNVALVIQGVPVIGCIAAPMFGRIWRGVTGQGAERLELPTGADASACRKRQAIRTRRFSENSVVVAISRSHFDRQTELFVARFPEAERIACGSSLKFCHVAEGSVDIYPRLAPTHEWDVAAGHAIVVAAGGMVVKPDGEPLAYGQGADGYGVPGFVACGDYTSAERLFGA
jgi:3'(2'), 5'-bisphosphate nucleotidase